MKAVTSQLQTAAAAGHSTAVATLATVTAAMQATWDPERGRKVRRALLLGCGDGAFACCCRGLLQRDLNTAC